MLAKSKDDEKRLAELRAKLEQVIGSNEALTYQGRTLITYKSTKARESFNATAFKTAHPDLAAQFTESKPGARVFRLKGGN